MNSSLDSSEPIVSRKNKNHHFSDRCGIILIFFFFFFFGGGGGGGGGARFLHKVRSKFRFLRDHYTGMTSRQSSEYGSSATLFSPIVAC